MEKYKGKYMLLMILKNDCMHHVYIWYDLLHIKLDNTYNIKRELHARCVVFEKVLFQRNVRETAVFAFNYVFAPAFQLHLKYEKKQEKLSKTWKTENRLLNIYTIHGRDFLCQEL